MGVLFRTRDRAVSETAIVAAVRDFPRDLGGSASASFEESEVEARDG